MGTTLVNDASWLHATGSAITVPMAGAKGKFKFTFSLCFKICSLERKIDADSKNDLKKSRKISERSKF